MSSFLFIGVALILPQYNKFLRHADDISKKLRITCCTGAHLNEEFDLGFGCRASIIPNPEPVRSPILLISKTDCRFPQSIGLTVKNLECIIANRIEIEINIGYISRHIQRMKLEKAPIVNSALQNTDFEILAQEKLYVTVAAIFLMEEAKLYYTCGECLENNPCQWRHSCSLMYGWEKLRASVNLVDTQQGADKIRAIVNRVNDRKPIHCGTFIRFENQFLHCSSGRDTIRALCERLADEEYKDDFESQLVDIIANIFYPPKEEEEDKALNICEN